MGLPYFDGHPRSGGLKSPGDVHHHGEHGKEATPASPVVTPEFTAEIVELCQRGNRTLRQVSRDFDLTETAVRDWVKQADLHTGTRTDGLTSTERDEISQLRRANRRLREDVDILKRATLLDVS